MNRQFFSLRVTLIAVSISCSVCSAFTQINIRLGPGLERDSSIWIFDGPGTWIHNGQELVISSNTMTREPYSRPSAIALLGQKEFGSFAMEMLIKCEAAPEELRGDLNIIFGYQGPDQFYYAHLTGTVDSLHNGIFIVNKADRKKVDFTPNTPVLPDREWHHVLLERDVATGEIIVYVDDNPEPFIKVTDRTFTKGLVGVGSFNDTGRFKDISITYKE